MGFADELSKGEFAESEEERQKRELKKLERFKGIIASVEKELKGYSQRNNINEVYFAIGSYNSFERTAKIFVHDTPFTFVFWKSTNRYEIFDMDPKGTYYHNMVRKAEPSGINPSYLFAHRRYWETQSDKEEEMYYDEFFNYFMNWAQEEGFKEYSIRKECEYSPVEHYKGILPSIKNRSITFTPKEGGFIYLYCHLKW